MSFGRVLYYLFIGWCLGGGLALFLADDPADGIIYVAVGLVLLIYRAYHPNMLKKKR